MQKQLFKGQGQSLVEIALLLPILVILFLGIAEVGFLLFSHVQVANATRSGARDGSLCRLNDNCATLTTVIETAVFAEAQSLNMNGGNTTVNVQSPNISTGEPFTVTVTYSHRPPFISNFVPMFPDQIPVKHTVVMHFDR